MSSLRTIGKAIFNDANTLDELFGTMTTTKDVKIIIVGQDSYNDRSKVTGMAFSYPIGMNASDSCLQMILAAIKGKDSHTTIYDDINFHGYLGTWRDQGVLMVNADYPNISKFIETIVAEREDSVCGILIGKVATDSLGKLFKSSFSWNHPSRRSIINNDPSDPRHWNHCDVFYKANDYLISMGICPVNWASVTGHNTLWIFTDGGYSAKKKRGAAGFVIFSSLQGYLGSWVKETKDYSTNNIAEATAIIQAMKTVKDYKCGKIKIMSDSQYCVKTITEWFVNWVKKGVLDQHKNVDLFAEATLLYKDINKRTKCTIIHVRGHQAPPEESASKLEKFFHMGNDYVDRLVNFSSK